MSYHEQYLQHHSSFDKKESDAKDTGPSELKPTPLPLLHIRRHNFRNAVNQVREQQSRNDITVWTKKSWSLETFNQFVSWLSIEQHKKQFNSYSIMFLANQQLAQNRVNHRLLSGQQGARLKRYGVRIMSPLTESEKAQISLRLNEFTSSISNMIQYL
jgi:hypothetical protein